MVVRMMKWLPWPPISSRKFQVYLTVHALEGVHPPPGEDETMEGVMVDVKWKGPKGSFFRRRSLKRVRTTEKQAGDNGIVRWEEESDYECVFTEAKNNSSFQPWDVHFVILKAIHQGGKTKLSVTGTAVMNIADFVSVSKEASMTTRINVSGSSGGETDAALVVTVSFVELWANPEGGDAAHSRPSMPCISAPFFDPQQLAEGSSDRVLKNAKRPAEGKVSQELYVLDSSKVSSRSEGSSHDTGALFDSDSVEEYDDGRVEDGEDSSFRKSFSYGTLAGVNLVLEGALPSFREGESAAERIASIHSRVVTDAMPKVNEDVLTSDSEQAVVQQTMRSLLSWKKRKLSFRPTRAKGEPLLNKSYGDDGGDDIDHDRRQSCSSPIEQLPALGWKDESTLTPNVSGCLDFGDEKFSVGCWEKKEFVSRDGYMKLSANVFFASIDQRNERAAGESACTALVAVIADWLHRNPNRMPIKAEFDSLIREGSAEWRRLCENETYQNRFPDGHFDLDTVLQAKVRPLRVAPERSFVGFFQPEGVGDMCDFLQGAMLFDNIWDAIIEETINVKPKDSCEPAVYIVSWNDHFFILKVDPDAYYIIDTLGERLYEGCDQAYIIRFDKEARLCHVPKEQNEGKEKARELGSLGTPAGMSAESGSSSTSSPEVVVIGQQKFTVLELGEGGDDSNDAVKVNEDEPDYKGKEACKCFLKEFFAAVPLRELQVDIKKGLLGKLPLHQRLQIEFHFMSLDASNAM